LLILRRSDFVISLAAGALQIVKSQNSAISNAALYVQPATGADYMVGIKDMRAFC